MTRGALFICNLIAAAALSSCAATLPVSKNAQMQNGQNAETIAPVFTDMTDTPWNNDGPMVRTPGVYRQGVFPGGEGYMVVLAPKSIGRTTEARPRLYWFTSIPIPEPIDFLVTTEDQVDPIFKGTLQGGVTSGIKEFFWSGRNIQLDFDKEYRWSVVVKTRTSQGSSETVDTTGGVKRIHAPDELVAQLGTTPAEQLPDLYRKYGLWYDALGSFARLLAAQPQNGEWRRGRAQLLQEVGLPEVAAYDEQVLLSGDLRLQRDSSRPGMRIDDIAVQSPSSPSIDELPVLRLP